MALLTVINNPFNPNDKIVSQIYAGTPIFHYLNNQEEYIEYVVSLNGIITEDYEYILKSDDHIAIVAIPKGGGGGKNPLRLVAMLAVSIFAAPLAGSILGASASTVAFGSITYGTILGGAIQLVGGMLVNALLPAQTPSVSDNNNLESVSPTYAFSGSSNAREVGTTLPIMLGQARVTPPIIGSYLSLEEGKQYLNVLMAVNDGQVDSISDIQINGQSIENFNDVSYETRLGTNDQSTIGNFRNTETTVSLQRNLNEQNLETTYTTLSNTIDELEVVVMLPRGLYNIDKKGKYKNYTISFEIAYKKSDDETWTTVQKSITSVYKRTERFAYSFKNLEKAQYDVKIKRVSSYSETTTIANELQLDYINEIIYDDFIYPGVALLSVNAMATDQLNGGFPTITCLVDNKLTRDALKSKNNPAWACYDILKRDGVEDINIDLDKFETWANWCDEKGYKCNLYLDQQMELQSALNMISTLGRATVVQFGSKFAPIVDMPQDIPTQSFLFTGANIIKSSFSMEYLPYAERTNVVEITYYDEEDNYKAKTVQVQSHDFNSTTREIKSSINLYGCTLRNQALSYAKYLLNNNRYLTETVSFTADIDAIACQVGDVISVGKRYMTNTLADGRIVDATQTTIILDQEVDLESGVAYEIQYRTLDDNIHIIGFNGNGTTTDTINVNIEDIEKVPQKFDVYAFGRQDTKAVNLYRVINISRASDFKRKIVALEYNNDVYNDSLEINVENVIIDYNVRSLSAYETLEIRPDGGIDEILNISWHSNALRDDVYINDKFYGKSTTQSLQIKNELVRDRLYKIKVGNKTLDHIFLGLNATVDAPEAFSVTALDTHTLLSWEEVQFAKGYRLYHNGSIIENMINATTYNYKLLPSGTHTFMIEALNAENYAQIHSEITLEVSVPLSPNVNVSYSGENIIIEWEESNSTYPIRHYIINHNGLETISKTTTYSTKVLWQANSITVQAVDIAGNLSTIRTANSNIVPPVIKNITNKVIDNNVLLYWEYETKTLPIKEFEIRSGTSYETSTLIGRRVGTFTSLFESLGGDYTYWFTPIDSAGNAGQIVSTTVNVNEPPDYVLNAQWYSDFSGTKINAVSESGTLYIGVVNETWEEHFINNYYTNIQDQINAGFPMYGQPFATSGSYEEIFDYGTVLGSTGVTVVPTYELVGDTNIQIDISVSTDGVNWIEHINKTKVIEADFRYVKVNISSTSDVNSVLKITRLELRLDSKLKNDGGNATSYSSDTNGTTVTLNKDFVDITSITITPKGTTSKIGIYDFEDTPNPTEFKVLIFDNDGNRITSDFSWSVKGY